MSDNTQDKPMDLSKLSDDSFQDLRATVQAETKSRGEFTFDDKDWAGMGDNEFAITKQRVFSAYRQHSAERRLRDSHAEYEALKQSRSNG